LKFPTATIKSQTKSFCFSVVNNNLDLFYNFYNFDSFVNYYNLSTSMFVWPKYSFYLKKISNVKKIKVINYFTLFIKTLMKNGNFLKLSNNLLTVFKFFFFFLKKKNLSTFSNNNFVYFHFISLFFLNNNNSLVSVNTLL
jgi:hypothetical protein